MHFLRGKKLMWLGILVVILLVSTFGCKRKEATKKIGFIVTTLGNPFFVNMIEAAEEEVAKHENIKLLIHAPERETGGDIERQIQIMENLIAQKVDIICVVPADSKGIISAIRKANEAKIPVLNIDNKIDRDLASERGVYVAGFIGSDNYSGGKIAAEYIVKRLNSTGEVAILEGVSGTDAARDRKAGFIDYVKDYPGVKIVASQPADWSREKGLNVFQNISQANPEVQALFACNDEMALGAVQAIKSEKKEGRIIVVGFDAIDDALEAIKNGTMDATVAQQPKEMGKLAILRAIDVLNKKEIPPIFLTDLKLVTADDLD